MEEKLCARCGKNPRHRSSYCKECWRDKAREHYYRHVEECRDRSRRYAKTHKEHRRAYAKVYYSDVDHAQKRREYSHAYWLANGPAKTRRWRWNTREHYILDTAVPLRINARVTEEVPGKWIWTVTLSLGVTIRADEPLDSRGAAWVEVLDFVKGFKCRIGEENTRMLAEVEAAKAEG